MKSRYQSADEIGIRYIELSDAAGMIRALNLVVIAGVRCASCGGGPATEKSKPSVNRPLRHRASHWHLVCATCDRPWQAAEPVESIALRSRRKIRARRNAVEDRLIRYTDEWWQIRQVVEPRPHRLRIAGRSVTLSRFAWDFALLCWLTYLRADVGSVGRVVELGVEHRPQFGHWWTQGKVRREIERARRVVEQRASRKRWVSIRRAR